MTEEKLKEIEDRAEKATGINWSYEIDESSKFIKISKATIYAGRDNLRHGLNLFGRIEPDWNGENNLEFICNAKKDIVDLLKEVRSLKDKLFKLEE